MAVLGVEGFPFKGLVGGRRQQPGEEVRRHHGVGRARRSGNGGARGGAAGVSMRLEDSELRGRGSAPAAV